MEDVVGIIGRQLRQLGHEIVWEESNKHFLTGDMGINIIVEGFTQSTINLFADMRAKGSRFLMIATEEPTPKGFNHGTQPEMVKRQTIFPEAAKLVDGIVCLVPGQHVVDWYSQFAPTAYTELGYAKSLVRPVSYEEPDYDFGFYGSMSKRRLRILQRLANRTLSKKAVKVMSDFGTQVERDREMRRAKVILQLRKFEDMGLVSSSRCNTALCLGRPVVAEPHLLSKPWDSIVKFTDSLDEFYNQALMMKANWRSVHAMQMARFKALLPPEACIGQALDKIGILQERKAA